MRQVSLGSPRSGSNDPFARWVMEAFRTIESASQAERFVDIVSAYTVTNYTKTRTLDASTATAGDIANFLATLIADLKAAEVVKG